METYLWIPIGVVGTLLLMLLMSLKSLFYVGTPNRVLIFSGTNRRVSGRHVGYRVIKGGNAWRRPFIEKVDVMDLTNMIIELNASGAYAKGGVPLNVQGVANVKIAGHEPILNNAIERFLGKPRPEIMRIAKATLEGSLRGVLSTLTPEELNEDRNLFNEKLVQEVEQDMTALGLIVDSLKIQNITDDVGYLDSIGRIRNAGLLSSAKIAEATARADSEVRTAENLLQESKTSIEQQTRVAIADADRRLADALTRRSAVVAEETATVAALVAQAEAETKVQEARIEQVRQMLEADVVAPARAECEASELRAKADVAKLVQDGIAKADSIRQLAETWSKDKDNARQVLMVQKIEPILQLIADTIAETRVEQVTVLGSQGQGLPVAKLIAVNEQLKEVLGIDLVEKVSSLGTKTEVLPAADEPPAS